MSRPPYGYRQVKDGDTVRWEQEPQEAEAIRRAYHQGMEVTRAKAILQTILNSAHVWKDRKIEFEFR